MKFSRKWAMPNANTFEIGVIQDFVVSYMPCEKSIDPFANRSRLATTTNDINPEFGCDFCMDAIEFIGRFETQSIDLVLFDPPYSPRQVSECYKALGLTVNMQTTQASFWRDAANEISRIVKPNGHVLSFGWNSTGMGVVNGFEIVEIMLVAHGGAHNDTICLAERKIQGTLF